MDEEYQEFEAKTVDEAIIQAMKAFKVDFEDLDIKVLSEGSKGLFGLVGTKTAKILARRVTEQEMHPAPMTETVGAPIAEQKSKPIRVNPSQEFLLNAQEVVSEVLRLMNMPCDVRIHLDNTLEIVGDGSGLIIGKRGQTLDSLQFLVNRIMNKTRQEPSYVTLDTEGYRQRHVSHLKAMAIKMAQKAKRTGQSMSFEKMNPYDRRIIHLALKNENGLNTKSIGEGVYKKLLIIPRKASR
jgi:spoIIIJ-associated protein